MGKQYKVVSINDVLENAALQTKEYNSKQEYYDDDKTYFQMFHDNAESIIKSTPSTSKYTSDETTGDLVLDLGNKKIDISNYTEEDYKALSDDLSHELAAKEIEDTIKTNPELSDLNSKLSNGDVWVNTDFGYASVMYTGDNDVADKLPSGNLIFSIQSKEDCHASLNSDEGFRYISEIDGVYKKSIKEGLEDAQSYLYTLEEEVEYDKTLESRMSEVEAEMKKECEAERKAFVQEQKSRSSFRP